MTLEHDKVQDNFPKKGFVETRDRDHIFYHDGRKTHIRTHVSNGSKYKAIKQVTDNTSGYNSRCITNNHAGP